MQIMPIDLTEVIAIVMGVSIILVPVIGLTARFALKPTVEALVRVFERQHTNETIQMLERRVNLLEQQVDAVEGSVGRLEDADQFDRQLRGATDEEQIEIPG